MSKDFDPSYFIRPEATLYDEITRYGTTIQTLQIDNHQASIVYGLPIEELLRVQNGYTIIDTFFTDDEFDDDDEVLKMAISTLEDTVHDTKNKARSEQCIGLFIFSYLSDEHIAYAVCHPQSIPEQIVTKEEVKLQRALKGSYLK